MNILGDGVALDSKSLNTTLERVGRFQGKMDPYDGSNDMGLFKLRYQKKIYYFITHPGKQVVYP